MANALSLTEKHSTQIELLRRRLVAAPEPSPATRRITFLQGIATATEQNAKDLADRTCTGWDTDAVEDMWSAVLTYVRDMSSLFNEVSGLKDAADRAVDKSAVSSFLRFTYHS